MRELDSADSIDIVAGGRDFDPPGAFSPPYAVRTLLDELTLAPVVLRDGRIAYRLKVARKGRTHRVMAAMDFMARLAALIPDHRDPALITHTVADILRARILAIACGGACPRAGGAGPVGGRQRSRLRRHPRRHHLHPDQRRHRNRRHQHRQ